VIQRGEEGENTALRLKVYFNNHNFQNLMAINPIYLIFLRAETLLKHNVYFIYLDTKYYLE
jgi:hypothetical protein